MPAAGFQQKKLRRAQVVPFFKAQPPAVIGIEACGTAHHWGRTVQAPGQEVRLIPAPGRPKRASSDAPAGDHPRRGADHRARHAEFWPLA